MTANGNESREDVAFLSGAALSHLHFVLGLDIVPQELMRDRLALRAAESCIAHSGRPERAGELRDTIAFLQPGDSPGPAGDIYLSWRRAVERPNSLEALHRSLVAHTPVQIAKWLGPGSAAPVTRAATVFETIMAEAPRQEVSALILADAALAQGLGWKHIVPLLGEGLKRSDLLLRGDELLVACHRAATKSAIRAARLAADLSRRSEHIKSVAPKLRSKGAGAAVEVLLTQDAVAPSALPLPNRAARRLCDRLIDLGAVRELTGRDTFRLYGV
ncbi:DUF1403 family protein [Cognatishimia sp.]|uniref:DUF1403 family protein n=1 Tax=Cognatishimia sp. TaxID=2211648 RepID=UPI0035176CFC